MSYNSRLFNVAKLRKIVECTDDISNTCETVADHLAEYENINSDYGTSEEQKDAREEQREQAWGAMGELLASADELRALRDTLYDETSEKPCDYRRMVTELIGSLLSALDVDDIGEHFEHDEDRVAARVILAEMRGRS